MNYMGKLLGMTPKKGQKKCSKSLDFLTNFRPFRVIRNRRFSSLNVDVRLSTIPSYVHFLTGRLVKKGSNLGFLRKSQKRAFYVKSELVVSSGPKRSTSFNTDTYTDHQILFTRYRLGIRSETDPNRSTRTNDAFL